MSALSECRRLRVRSLPRRRRRRRLSLPALLPRRAPPGSRGGRRRSDRRRPGPEFGTQKRRLGRVRARELRVVVTSAGLAARRVPPHTTPEASIFPSATPRTRRGAVRRPRAGEALRRIGVDALRGARVVGQGGDRVRAQRREERGGAVERVGALARRGPPQRGHDCGRRAPRSLRVSSVPSLRAIDRATAASAAASCAARRAEETLPPLFRSHVRGMSEALATPAPASAARSQRS